MRTKTNPKMSPVMALFFVVVVGISCPALAVSWKVTQVTDNSYDDEYPRISGSNVVWQGGDGNDFEIFFWDVSMGEPCQVTENSYDDSSPQISGSNVVWQGGDGNDLEIFFREGEPASEPTNISNNSYEDSSPQISGSNVVWEGEDDSGYYEIFFWDGEPTSELVDISNNIYDDYEPQISGANVVWRSWDGYDSEIFFWNASMGEPCQVTDNSYEDSSHQISGSNVVWRARVGGPSSDWEILFWDGTSMGEPFQVTDNSNHDYDPQISGSNVVWSGWHINNTEIFFWNGDPNSEPINISNRSYSDVNPQISGSNVVWEGHDGNDKEIFFWDGTTITQLTDNNYSDGNPRISGSNVVWEGWEGDDNEIFMAVCSPIIYVDANAKGANNGSSWADAYNHLQDALAAADPCDEIRVAEGTYKPDAKSSNPGGSGDRTATFQLINAVAIKGGYAGFGETDPDHRDIALYKTILSGDINTPGDNSDNSYHVVTGSGTEPNAFLDGFTITAGNANGSYPHSCAGGLFNDSGSPTVTNCTFRINRAGNSGGGMYNRYSAPTLTNCIFSVNSAETYGGGMRNYQSSPALNNCTLIGNSADSGGGMGSSNSSSPTVTNCTFSGNSAADLGGGMYNWNGGSPTVSNCILWGNIAGSEAQIYNDGTSSATVDYSDVEGGWNGIGNIPADPLFVDANGPDGIAGTEDDNVHLRGYSPCINAGDPGGDYSGQVDVDGQPRVAYGRVDMGADEVFPAAGDFEPDGDVDFADFAIFAGNWLLGVSN